MIAWLYEILTGRPATVQVSMAAQFGPPPAVEFARELAGLSDLQIMARGDRIVAEARAARRALPAGVGGR